jgi:hypothetical protein
MDRRPKSVVIVTVIIVVVGGMVRLSSSTLPTAPVQDDSWINMGHCRNSDL